MQRRASRKGGSKKETTFEPSDAQGSTPEILEMQSELVEKLEGQRDDLKEQILHLTTTLETLRARLLALTLGADASDGVPLDDLLGELNREVEVLEETVQVMAHTAGSR